MSDVPRKRIIQEYYGRRASDYDRQKARTWQARQGFSDQILDELFDSLPCLCGKLVLEVCIGTARTTLPLMKKIKPCLIGLDLSREMLEIAKSKLSSYKKHVNLILGDAEHLPFKNNAFTAIVCTSALHYFTHPERSLEEFSRILMRKGIFVHGDLTLHESDSKRFLDRLEKTISPAHASYSKSSEIRKMLKTKGFHISTINTICYSKTFNSLAEDKGKYFNITLETLKAFVNAVSENEKKLYSVKDNELTLFYTLVQSWKEKAQ